MVMKTSMQAFNKYKFQMSGQGLILREIYKDTICVFAAHILNYCSTWNGPCVAICEGPGQQTGGNTGYSRLHVTCSQAVPATVRQKESFQEVLNM